MNDNKLKEKDANRVINVERASDMSQSDNESDDEIEKLLMSKEKERLENNQNNNIAGDSERHLLNFIASFLNEPRVKHSKCKNVRTFQKLKMPLLHFLSKTALSAPATQVSVERLFFVLKLVLSNQRPNLSEEMCNDIMFIRCNDIFRR